MTVYSALTVVASEAQASALGSALEELAPAPIGVGVFEVEDGSGVWEVSAWFDGARPDIASLAILAALHQARDFAVSRVDNRDWVAQVRRELHPVDVGRFTIHGGHDRDRIGPHRTALLIEAAMAFGTGHHGSTQGCLRLFERLLRRGAWPRRIADIGAGTGVLAMAGVKAVRARVIASDIDPVARDTARENARANGTQPWTLCLAAPGFRAPELRHGAPYDIVFANILAGPLKRLAPEIARHLRPGGVAILAGLLTEQAAGVEAVFAGHGLRRHDAVTLGEWRSLALRRA